MKFVARTIEIVGIEECVTDAMNRIDDISDITASAFMRLDLQMERTR